jgi:WD40 repeat protein
MTPTNPAPGSDLDGRRPLGVWAEGNGTGEFQSVVLSPDGRRLATAGYKGLQTWDTETGKRPTREYTPGRASPRRLAFTPDGRYLVAAADDRVVSVWDPAPMVRLARGWSPRPR